MGSEPLSLSLGCLAASGHTTEHFSPSLSSPLTTNSLNRKKLKSKCSSSFRRSWGPTEKEEENQEFWALIKEPYDFIMDTHLMPETYQLNEGKDQQPSSMGGELELSWDPADVSPSYEWSHSEFLDQYNELYEWLIQVQIHLYSGSNPPDKISRMAQLEELNRQAFRRKLFVEQGENVASRCPSYAEEISWKVNYLNNKWELLLTTLAPNKGQTREIEVELDLVHEEELLCNWLITMEGQIQPITCRLPKGSSVQILQERYRDNQILLKDIEAHGPILKSVIRQYERVARNDANDQSAKLIEESSTSTPPIPPPSSPIPNSNECPLSTPPFSAIEGAKNSKKPPKVPRRARSLEKRWHQIYLRSLEWHYYLEGAIDNFKNRSWSSNSSESEDEPLTKCRKISESPIPSRRRSRASSWSHDELNASETGSYIEDDYVHLSDHSSPRDQRKRIRRERNEDIAIVPMETIENELMTKESVEIQKPKSIEEQSIDKMVEKSPKSAEECKDERVTQLDNATKDLSNNEVKNEGSPQKARSSLTQVDRPSSNYGVFDYRHHDTDSEDQQSNEVQDDVKVTDVVLKVPKRSKTRTSPFRRSAACLRRPDYFEDEELEQAALQQIIDSAIADENWLNSNLTSSDSESMTSLTKQELLVTDAAALINPKDDLLNAINGNDYVVPLIHRMGSSSMASSQESLHRLISDVDQLVHQHPMIPSPRQCLKPLSFGTKEVSKQRRIKQWLSTQNDSSAIDSCDASGELTTGESDVDSESSCRHPDDSTIRRSSGDLLGSSENTPTVEVLPSLQMDQLSKVIRRGKKRSQKEQRPWSMTEFHHVVLSGKGSFKATVEGKTNLGKNGNLSVSESVLNKGLCVSSEQLSQELTSPSPEDNDRTMTLLTPGGSASPSENFSSDSPITPSLTKRFSPLLGSAAESLKKRRPKFRRRSLKHLGRRSGSGSDDHDSGARTSDGKTKFYSPYHHSITKELSSEQEESATKPTSIAKVLVDGVTSSTEQYLSDASLVYGIPKPGIESPVLPSTSTPRTNNNLGPLSPRSCGPFTPRTNPSDNDAANTHDSSLSEQAWDPYQEFKEFSEPYSEDFDHDAARRLMDFGDDYRKYIDSDSSSLRFPLSARKNRKSPKRIRKTRLENASDQDEDSDLEDLQHVMEESKSQLIALESLLDKGPTIAVNYNELLTTAKTNINCLQEISKHLQSKTSDFHSKFSLVQDLLQRWESLDSKVVEKQRQCSQLYQLQRQIKTLNVNLEQINDKCSILAHPHSLAVPSELKQKAEEAKDLLDETECLKTELSALNVLVHRFGGGEPVGSELKDEVADLYRLYDETRRRISGEVSRFESADATWRLWDEQKSLLMEALKQDSETLNVLDAAINTGRLTESVTASVQDVAKLLNERRKLPNKMTMALNTQTDRVANGEPVGPAGNSRASTSCSDSKDGHISDSGTSGYESCSSDDLSERERRLAYLRRLARDLEANLVPGSKAWNDICSSLSHAERELQGLQSQCRNLVRKTADTFDQSEFKNVFFPSSPRRRSWSRERKLSARSDKKKRSSRSGNWLGRVVRAALPFQVALLLLLCVACLLEPNCCDSLNTLNLSLSPQLRYVHGQTPV